MSGNPVKLGDGYATVTGYKLPQPLVIDREGGSEVRPEVRIPISPRSSGRLHGHFSVKEKDEASPIRSCGPGFVRMPSFSVLPWDEGVLFLGVKELKRESVKR